MRLIHSPAPMMRNIGPLLLVICISQFVGLTTPAAADDDAKPNRVLVEYVPPTNPVHQAVYDALKQARALERAREIFSPFKLPIDLTIKTMGCDGVSNAWYSRPNLTLCYEYLDEILRTVPKETTPEGVTPADAFDGQFVYIVAHEMGHAMFDYLDAPVWGRGEDAADAFSAYMMLRHGKDEARRLIEGAAYSYKDYVQNPAVTEPLKAFSDEHGAPMQRYYNLQCVGYGAEPDAFADLIKKGYLPKERADRCKDEYWELNFAFNKTIKPHLDEELVKKVHDEEWLPKVTARKPPKANIGTPSPN